MKKVDQDWCTWSAKGDGLYRAGRWKEALACYRRALRANPCDTTGREAYLADLHAAAACLRHLGREREATRCEDEARALRRAMRRR